MHVPRHAHQLVDAEGDEGEDDEEDYDDEGDDVVLLHFGGWFCSVLFLVCGGGGGVGPSAGRGGGSVVVSERSLGRRRGSDAGVRMCLLVWLCVRGGGLVCRCRAVADSIRCCPTVSCLTQLREGFCRAAREAHHRDARCSSSPMRGCASLQAAAAEREKRWYVCITRQKYTQHNKRFKVRKRRQKPWNARCSASWAGRCVRAGTQAPAVK